MKENDLEILKENTVDFVSLSYYNSRCVRADGKWRSRRGKRVCFCEKPASYQQSVGMADRSSRTEDYVKHAVRQISKSHCLLWKTDLEAKDTPDENGFVDDDYRIEYLSSHVKAMMDAVEKDGVDLIGYTAWGWIDLVSATTGEMSKRYGMVYVDLDDFGKGTGKRIPKNRFIGIKM